MDLAFHLVAKSYFDSQDPQSGYTPADYARDGFIHCTDAPAEMAQVANRFYRAVQGPHYYLYIDKARVRAPIRYEDPGRLYPHIYGALNRDAILAVRPARRLDDGTFLAPEPYEI